MRKFIFTSLFIALSFLNVTMFAATFNPSNGTGNVTQAEIQAAYGWDAATYAKKIVGVSYIYYRTDRYTVVCQFTDSEGNIVNQTQTKDVYYQVGVKSNIVAAGVNFTGYGKTMRMNRIPAVGDGNLGCEGGLLPTIGGVARGGKLISVTYTTSFGPLLSNTVAFNGTQKIW